MRGAIFAAMSESASAATPPPSRETVFALVAAGVFMATLDGSIVNVSLNAIAAHFGVVVGPLLTWVVLAYLVVVAGLLLTVGRLADLLGHRLVWTVGLAIFTLGSALCCAAPSLGLLIAARAVQGIGGAFLMAIGPALLLSAFPASQRGRAIGLHGVVVSVGVSAGPVLGGLITERLGFRYIFYLNLPIGLIAALVSWWKLPAHAKKPAHFDGLGALLLAVALGTLTSALSLGGELGLGSFACVGLFLASLVSGTWLLVHLRKHPHPVIDLSLFRDRIFAAASASLTLSFVASYALSFLLPLYFKQLRGISLEQTGWYLASLPLTIAVLSPFTGALSDRVGTRVLAAFGMALLSVGLVILARLDRGTPLGEAVLGLMIGGVGQAIFRAPNNSALMGAAPRHRQGVASGVLATARVVGQTLSIALAGTIFTMHGSAEAGRALSVGGSGQAMAQLEQVFLEGYRASLHLFAGVAAMAALCALMRRRQMPH